ncbi:hypothetical protein NAEGRDRAFT_81193 [Naegleria gruberi]|uniref:Uncharacterized protein n=1 Tax=Naegleria gruberi TaxID=5762 RepID=D2VTS9_NAEGR|nr:uncharacterized protein NAEGRDRAFT_81193 [Naegleria gruberi]EFC39705.1 hypothetical protein NAEGRDRAFT_81193 [Naegleria gruberi]|eukprot:XP_002672449.1 hypothetical protein NAEGRDRAFT_81193 [Naegleria gruberi strain NEG-M]
MVKDKSLKSLREVALEYSDDISPNNFKERIWRLTMPVSFSKIRPDFSQVNLQKLPSHDILFNLCLNYLEIWEIFKLVKSCKFCYWSLLDDEELFWRQISKRDGFIGMTDETTTGEECSRIYCNLWASCLEFETLSNSAFVESSSFSTKAVSNNPQLFLNFKKRINGDFNQYLYIMMSEGKKRFFIQKYLVAFGFLRLNRGEEMKLSFQKTLTKLFQILCWKEDGATFEVGLDYEKTIVCNLVGLAFETRFKYLEEEFKNEVEIFFIKHAAFRVSCPKIITVESFYDRAIKIMERKCRENYNWNSCYDLLVELLKNPKSKLKRSNDYILIVRCFMSCTIRREYSIKLVVNLLKNDNLFDHLPIYELVCKGLKWFDPVIFDKLTHEKFYSLGCKEYYIEILTDYITTCEPLDLSIRQRALERILFIFNDPTVQLLEPIPYKLLKSIEQSSSRLNFETKELEDCFFNSWRKIKLVPELQMAKDLYGKNHKRMVDQLFELKLNPTTDPSLVGEMFEILTTHGQTLGETEMESQLFHWKFTEFFVDYCLHGEFKDTYNIQLAYRYLSMKYPTGVTAMLEAMQHAEKKSQTRSHTLKK